MNPKIRVRLKKLFSSFEKIGIDALFVSSWPNVTYLSGFQNTESWIFVSPKGLYFITDSRYLEQARSQAKGFKVILRDKKSVSEIAAELARKLRARSVGFESTQVTHDFYGSLVKAFHGTRLVPTRNLVETLRLVKDSEEIALIQKSADIAVKGFHFVKETAMPGMTERELQGRLEYYTKSIGSEKPAFDIIIAAGARASMPHCQTGQVPLIDNDAVLVDMGVVYEGYHSDLTRPVFLGKITAFYKKIYDIVWQAQRAGIRKAAPGIQCSEVDEACRSFIKKNGYGPNFGHGTGHGVGLEIHEGPNVSGKSQTILKPGMVITVEPGIYIPGKLGIRIEDMVLITEKGNKVMTDGLDE